MLKQDYFPQRLGDQVTWLLNLKTKTPGYATTLGLAPAGVTSFLLDIDNAVYIIGPYRTAVVSSHDAAFQAINEALNLPQSGEAINLPGFALPTPIPTEVPVGCLRRVFDYIANTIKKAPGYTEVIGKDMLIVPPAKPLPDPNVVPDFTLRLRGGKLEVVWTKGVYNGIALEFDLGTAGIKADKDFSPNYILNWMPPTGQTALIKVRIRYLVKDDEFGLWSSWQEWALMAN